MISDQNRELGLRILGCGALLGVATGLVWVLEEMAGVPDASSAFLLAVLVAAALFGTAAAVGVAVGAFLVYDFLFVDPTFTLTVRDPREWLNLLLFLVVGVVVARLAGELRERARTATAREREARALFRVSRVMATRGNTRAVLPEIASVLAVETRSSRAWISLPARSRDETDRVVADSGAAPPRIAPSSRAVLRRQPGDTPAEWVRVHQSVMNRSRASETMAWKVPIQVAGHDIGGVWVERPRAAGAPDRSGTRLLAATADQLGQALEQDRLAEEARDAELAREGEALKSALLDSVSHDLRTPLASIRAAAGSLIDRDVRLSDEERIQSAVTIDREAEHLARLVANLLDLSKIEGGALHTDREVYELADVVERAVERLKPRLGERSIAVDIPADVPPVRIDAVLFDQVLTNLLENAAKYASPDAPIAIRASRQDDAVCMTVEDGGPGVPWSALPRLFDKFYRVQRRGEGSRPGTGIGLAVVRGLTEAMGGSVSARRSRLGGLAVDVVVPAAPLPGLVDADDSDDAFATGPTAGAEVTGTTHAGGRPTDGG